MFFLFLMTAILQLFQLGLCSSLMGQLTKRSVQVKLDVYMALWVLLKMFFVKFFRTGNNW